MRFVRNIKFAFVALAVAFATISCITEESIPNSKREKISLEAWIRLNKPELLNNYQEDGGYYVEILDGDTNLGEPASENDFGSEPLMDQDTCWVFTNMTGRDINGAVCMTRSGALADMCGTFSQLTHYVPYINYCGKSNMGLLEGTYLAMRNELKIGDTTYKLHKGSKVRLYLPSTIAYGENGSSTEGGYEGQYALDPSRPLILDMEVLRAIKNPSDHELDMVSRYIRGRSHWTQATKSEEEKTDTDDDLKLKGLYYSYAYNPESDDIYDYRYLQPHLDISNTRAPYTDTKKYQRMEDINQQINDILLERFGKGLNTEDLTDDATTLVGDNGHAKIWYVLRFLDGFVVDTNIAEIRTLIFGESAPTCEVFSYSPSDDKGKSESERKAIGAWYYCIPKMHHGAYGQIITTSGYAYGAAGLSGTTTTETSSTTSSSDYYNAMNYYNYYNSYYNYYSPYYNYYDYNYYNYGYGYGDGDDLGETVTKITISTEILPYTPLVFTLYVEPYE